MLKIPERYKSLKYIHDIEWRDIFAVWRAYEAYQKMWEEHWRERGFASWDEWRKNYIAPLKPKKLKWQVFRIEKTFLDAPKIYGVPSRGWVKNIYNGKKTIPLAEVVELVGGEKNEKIKAVKDNFPYQTMLTGVINQDRIVLVEGMHRATALAMMKEGELIGDVVIALAEYNGELPLLGKG